jgi:hypothetical protein
VPPKGPVRTDVMTKGEGSNRIPVRKMFDAEKKKLTESNSVELSPVNIL